MTLEAPEVLAPAGDLDAMRAAVRAGADAVYFGLHGFNARARAKNFDGSELAETMAMLHEHGVRGYVTLNTLVFDDELDRLERAVLACAKAGVDAVIVQDLGVVRLVRAMAPDLPLHASTQMTCTDASSVELARSMGASRVILARELSLDEIATIRAQTDAELEVFVHGALCIAYSGQCLTSEAIGGRSANRGACAQACRLPYELIVDGEPRDLGDVAYLLSPKDLEASRQVPRLMELGIRSLKIEGRLKGPEYVAATTRLYRAAIDAALEGHGVAPESLRTTALQTFSRGSSSGFFEGVDHQRLVEGRACDHVGTLAGEARGVRVWRGGRHILMRTSAKIARGDGLLVEGGFAGEGELGGRVYRLVVRGQEVEETPGGVEALVWLGPDKPIGDITPGRRVWKTSDPSLLRQIRQETEREPHRVALDMRLSGTFGAKPTLSATSARGGAVSVEVDALLEPARQAPLSYETIHDKLGRLGDSPFVLRELDVELPEGSILPISALNRARRALVEALAKAKQTSYATTAATSARLLEEARPPEDLAPPPAGLFVLCRTEEQARAALDAGATGVYLDFLELTGTGAALRALREKGAAFVGVAPPRIRKPGEEKIERYLKQLEPDAVLVRTLGALHDGFGADALRIGDFSLNVANRLTASEVLAHGLSAFTPSFDLDASQLVAMLKPPFSAFAEVVVHHPMPLFHMEHCVIAALLSEGRDYKSCGRPCETHKLSLRDRTGMVHPVEADVGCRNTVFHAAAQSGASLVSSLSKAGVRRFRIELLRENASEVERIVKAYRRLLAAEITASEVVRALEAEGGYGVVRGSLRVLG